MLGKRAFSSVVWAGAGRAGRAVSQVVFMLFLGRAIGPSGFAAASIALVGYQLVTTVAAQSFSQALVRYHDEDANRDASAFWLNLVVSAALVLVISALAPLAARLLSLPELMWLLPALSALAALVAFTPIAQARLSHYMDFRQIAQIESVSAAISTLAGVVAVLWGELGLEALLIYAGVQRVVEFAMFMGKREAWPTARPSGLSARELMQFTLPLVSMQVLAFINGSIDQFFVGKVNNPAQLGQFSLGRRLTQQPAQMISFAIGRAIFPALVHARKLSEGLAPLFLASVRNTAMAAAIPLLLLSAVADDFVTVALGSDWTPAGKFLALFSASSITVPVGAVFAAILRAEGHTRVQLVLQLFRLVTSSVILGVLAAKDASAWEMALAVAAITLVSITAPAIECSRRVHVPLLDIVSALIRGLLPGLLIYGLLTAANLSVLSPLPPMWRLLTSLGFGSLVATICLLPTLKALKRSRGQGI